MTAEAQVSCPRCSGKLRPEGFDGDKSCFTCGHIVYRETPIPLPANQPLRRPSHGGRSLS
jgi:hypothetical protein